jgi:hypothetical protein
MMLIYEIQQRLTVTVRGMKHYFNFSGEIKVLSKTLELLRLDSLGDQTEISKFQALQT